MNRILAISLAMLIVISTNGIVVFKHYCGSNYTGSSVFFTPKNCCNTNCKKCHNETIQIKIKDSFKSFFTDFNFGGKIIDILKSFLGVITTNIFTSENNKTNYYNKLIPFVIKTCNTPDFLQVFRL